MNDDAIRAKADPGFRDSFIENNSKFILACAYKAVGHFITLSDDEWSIALIAFNEAIDSFDEGKGNFSSLASLIIKRRLTDYLRTEYRHSPEVLVDRGAVDGEVDEESEGLGINLEVRKREAEMSMAEPSAISSAVTIKDEIEALTGELGGYGFSFFDLTECSPKAEKTKKSCAEAIRNLYRDKALMDKMRSSHTLPIADIQKKSGLPRKILERHRKYIIAGAEILGGDYPRLSEYLGYIKDDPGRNIPGVSPAMMIVLMGLARYLC